jgi:hypothetical protein
MVRSEGNMSLKIPVTPRGMDPGTVRLVAQRLNHYAIPGPVHFKRARTNLSVCSFFWPPLYMKNVFSFADSHSNKQQYLSDRLR